MKTQDHMSVTFANKHSTLKIHSRFMWMVSTERLKDLVAETVRIDLVAHQSETSILSNVNLEIFYKSYHANLIQN